MTQARNSPSDRGGLRYGELDRDLVVDAVLRLAARGNLQKVTMRALAAELGITPGALYYHVEDRGDLMDIAAEAVLARIKIPSADLPWDTQLRALFMGARQVLLPVTGIAAVLQARPMSPSARRLDEASSSILSSAGFGRGAARAGKMALVTFLLGAVALEQALSTAYPPEDRTIPFPVFQGRDFGAGLDTIIAGLKYRKEIG